MRISRIVAVGVLALGLLGTASAAYADDLPIDPPPVVAPPAPAPPAPEPAPVVTPPPAPVPVAPPTPSAPSAPSAPPRAWTADEISLRDTGFTVAGYAAYQAELAPLHRQLAIDGAASLLAFAQQYGDAVMSYQRAHPGSQIGFHPDTGLFTDASGALVDISGYGPVTGTSNEGVSDSASVEELEAIVAEPLPLFTAPLAIVEPEPSETPTSTAADDPEEQTVAVEDNGGTAIAAAAGWTAAAALAFWRRRFRAYELLKIARAAVAG